MRYSKRHPTRPRDRPLVDAEDRRLEEPVRRLVPGAQNLRSGLTEFHWKERPAANCTVILQPRRELRVRAHEPLLAESPILFQARRLPRREVPRLTGVFFQIVQLRLAGPDVFNVFPLPIPQTPLLRKRELIEEDLALIEILGPEAVAGQRRIAGAQVIEDRRCHVAVACDPG